MIKVIQPCSQMVSNGLWIHALYSSVFKQFLAIKFSANGVFVNYEVEIIQTVQIIHNL